MHNNYYGLGMIKVFTKIKEISPDTRVTIAPIMGIFYQEGHCCSSRGSWKVKIGHSLYLSAAWITWIEVGMKFPGQYHFNFFYVLWVKYVMSSAIESYQQVLEGNKIAITIPCNIWAVCGTSLTSNSKISGKFLHWAF